MIVPFIIALGVFFVLATAYFALAPETWSFKKRLKKYALSNANNREEQVSLKGKSASVVTQKESSRSDFLFKGFGADPHTLRAKLLQAGLKITVLEFLFYQVFITMLVAAAGILLVNTNIVYSVVVASILGVTLPRMWLRSKITKRIDSFNKLFPDAIEMMLSVTKSGLPLINALQSVADNSLGSVRGEFNKICSEVSLGIQLADAVAKATERVPSQEMSFFAISLSIQLETGGSLTDTFNNLAKILRNRQDLKRLIASKSSEAKMQAKVLGGLILLIICGLYAMDPQYVGVFLHDEVGKLVGIGLLVWMSIGFYMMNQMTKFEY
jgi:tight adherence protein B